MNATLNGRDRKTLAQQLDRMDSMLDGLAEGLNEAVAAAAAAGMKEVVCIAVQQAVRTTLTELLSNPDVRQHVAVESPRKTTGYVAWAKAGWNWLANVAKWAWTTSVSRGGPTIENAREVAVQVVASAKEKTVEGCTRVVRAAQRGWMMAQFVAALTKRYRFQVAAAIAVGAAFGLVGWWGGREIAAFGCGVSGFTGSLASLFVKQPREADSPFVKFQS